MIYLPIVTTSVRNDRLFLETETTIIQERNRFLGIDKIVIFKF